MDEVMSPSVAKGRLAIKNRLFSFLLLTCNKTHHVCPLQCGALPDTHREGSGGDRLGVMLTLGYTQILKNIFN